MADFRLEHLARTVVVPGPGDRCVPHALAYSAMADLVFDRFLMLTRWERARQVHLGPNCQPVCDLCRDIALKHVQWATDKVAHHLQTGPPRTRGEIVRDWVTILKWVSSPLYDHWRTAELRSGLFHRIPADDDRLPFVLAIGTQLLPTSGNARGPRRIQDFVGDPRRSVFAQREGWSVKPDRDLAGRRGFQPFWQRYPWAMSLLTTVVKRLDNGDWDAFSHVIAESGDPGAAVTALRACIAALVRDPDAADWFQRNVIAREDHWRRVDRNTWIDGDPAEGADRSARP